MAKAPDDKLKPDPLVERIIADPAEIPDVRVLIGFVGKSARDGYWRLYSTPALDDYVEFSAEDVVHSHSLEEDASRLGGSLVWLKRSANLQRTRTQSREAQQDFLQGAIAARGARRTLAPGIVNAMLGWGRATGHQIGSVAVHASCVREFCEFVAVSWLGGGDVYCTGSFECSSSWQAECP